MIQSYVVERTTRVVVEEKGSVYQLVFQCISRQFRIGFDAQHLQNAGPVNIWGQTPKLQF
jgi:hypothetical protein